MDEIIKELRAKIAEFEAKFADLDAKSGTSAGEISALKEMKAELKAEIERLRAEIAAREAGRTPVAGVTGDADIDEVLK